MIEILEGDPCKVSNLGLILFQTSFIRFATRDMVEIVSGRVVLCIHNVTYLILPLAFLYLLLLHFLFHSFLLHAE